jgi:outer membrane protein assembly factor BamA
MRFSFPAACLAACLGLGLAAGVRSQEAPADPYPFVVKDFRVEGAQRISEGTIYNYLPINIGDTLTAQRSARSSLRPARRSSRPPSRLVRRS